MTVDTVSSGSDMCNLRSQEVGCSGLHFTHQPSHGALLDLTTGACLVCFGILYKSVALLKDAHKLRALKEAFPN